MSARILLVEDDLTTRRSFFYLLTYANYQVAEAADGESALHLLAKEQFDVVITDIIMAEIDGMEVLHVARNQPYAPEVIVITGHSSFETAVVAVREGAFDYLVKPCDGDLLCSTVDRALQRRRSQQDLRTAAEKLLAALQVNGIGCPQPQQSPPVSSPMIDEEADEQCWISVRIGAIVIGPTRNDVSFDGHEVRLTQTEYMLLRYLAEHSDQLCPSQQIVRHTHHIEIDAIEAQALVKPHIHNLRKKLHPDYFVNERGLGYRLIVPPCP
jgi:DNA-binding response OmpR family regulator